ncbi:hypothetical protein [Xanthobacter autotrophicus]|uniref:hypothetical protein n=1 Tax=Xanthobacter autotrophicus TaxID=280 RepID=UPI00372B3417
MTKTDQDREAFETAARSDGLAPETWDEDEKMYIDSDTQWMWQGWQAALAHERARAASPAPQVPDGWKLVPYAVTPNMERAAATAFERGDPTWPALLDAAPPAPVASHEPASVKWAKAALDTLAAYEADLGEPLPDDHEIGRIDESRGAPSFRIRVGHIRQLAASRAIIQE